LKTAPNWSRIGQRYPTCPYPSPKAPLPMTRSRDLQAKSEQAKWQAHKIKHNIKLSRKQTKNGTSKRYCINYKNKTYYFPSQHSNYTITDWYNLDEYNKALADWEFIVKPDLDHPDNIGTFTRIREQDSSGNLVYKDVWIENDPKHNKTLGHFLREFLESKYNLGRKVGTIENAKMYVNWFIDYCGGGSMNANKVNKKLFLRYRGAIHRNELKGHKTSNTHTANQALNTAIGFIKYLFDEGGTTYFKINYSEVRIERIFEDVQIPPIEYVQDVLKEASDRTKLFCLLMLNCGFTQGDIGDLRVRQLDWTTGILWHRRKKQKDKQKTPTIYYKLSNTTLALLEKFAQKHGEFLLTTKNGTPYWRYDYKEKSFTDPGGPILDEDGTFHGMSEDTILSIKTAVRCDTIATAYLRLTTRLKKKGIQTWSLKYFRKCSSDHMDTYNPNCHRYMVGRFPAGVDEKSYKRFGKHNFLEVLPKFMKDTYNID
jgi:integrase